MNDPVAATATTPVAADLAAARKPLSLFHRKSIALLLAQAQDEGEGTLRRGLGAFHLTMLGVGAIVGAGIFVITGQAAAQHAGPAIALAFVIAGFVCALSALCYAELASMIPVAGSAYTYAYATLGQLIAWIIAWDLMAEYLFAAAAVSVGWSGYFTGLLANLGIHLPAALTQAPFAQGAGHALVATGALINLPAVMIVALVAAVLVVGISESARINAAIVMLKVGVVVLVIVFGLLHADPANWTPFIPPLEIDPVTGASRYGLSGVAAAAAVIFFAYLGFDSVSTAAQEARDPQRTLPISILASLALCTVLYILTCFAVTGMAPFAMLDVPAPIYAAVDHVGAQLAWLKPLVTIAATVGLASTLLSLLYGQSRIFYAMARDGLLPPAFGRVHPKRRTPVAGTAITAVIAAAFGGLFPIGVLGELVSIGTLLAFALICGGVIYLRLKRPDLPRGFRTPVWWLTAPLGIVSCLYLIAQLPVATFVRLLVWMAIGLVVYFAYARRHAELVR
ncbi:MAG: amino acid permease [Phenylobacterium sp.]